jgi:hypothetical protein
LRGTIRLVEPDRFDDVAFRIVEGPEPPRRPPRGRRWLLALAVAVLTTGALAAGASALGGGDDERARSAKPPKPRTNISYTERGTPFARDGRACEEGKPFGGHRKRDRRSADLRH